MHAIGHGGEASGNGGTGFIAHASDQSHYLQFYHHYLRGFKEGAGVPYSSSDQILTTLTQMGVAFETKEISYTNGAPETKERQVERYLQRCLFDDTVSLKEMLANSITGPYLETCRENGRWRFAQHVTMMFVNAAAGSVAEQSRTGCLFVYRQGAICNARFAPVLCLIRVELPADKSAVSGGATR